MFEKNNYISDTTIVRDNRTTIEHTTAFLKSSNIVLLVRVLFC